MVIMASEVGVLDISPENIKLKGRLKPGRIFLVDTKQKRIIDDGEIKDELAREHPYQDGLNQELVHIANLATTPIKGQPEIEDIRCLQRAFGYTEEDLKILIGPMGQNGTEAIG